MLYQLYAFLLPAFSKQQQRMIVPLLLMIPVLFIAGVAFGYFLVLPAAAKFLLNFNDSQFNVQVQAKEYYGFFAMTLLACGIVFQVPVGILAVTRLGIVKVEQLTKNRRYAYLVCAVVAAALPGVDPISMLLEMAPLIVLYEISILLAKAFGTPARAARRRASGLLSACASPSAVAYARSAVGDRADRLRRGAGADRPRRQVAVDDRVGADHAALADASPRWSPRS